MHNNILEVYNDVGRSCTQRCVHCDRGLGDGPNQKKIHKLHENQSEMIDRILSAFGGEGHNSYNQLNISGELATWEAPAIPKTKTHIHDVAFQPGDLSNMQDFSFQDLNDRMDLLLSGIEGQEKRPRGSMAMNAQKPIFSELNHIERFCSLVREYTGTILSGHMMNFDSKSIYISLNSNNMRKRDFRSILPQASLLQTEIIRTLTEVVQDPDSISLVKQDMSFYPENYVLTSETGFVLKDETTIVIGSRFIGAEGIAKHNDTNEIFDAYRQNDDFYVSVFPDKIMIHHSTFTVNDSIWWFTYDEFSRILNRVGKRNLRSIAHQEIKRRLKEKSLLQV